MKNRIKYELVNKRAFCERTKMNYGIYYLEESTRIEALRQSIRNLM